MARPDIMTLAGTRPARRTSRGSSRPILTVALAILALASALPGTSLASWTNNGNLAAAAIQNQVAAQSVSDGAGGIILVWEDYRNGNADVYAQRIDASGNLMWGGSGVAVATDTLAQEAPQAASDGAGGVIIAWQDTRSGAYDIYARAVSAAGVALGTANGVAICSAIGTQTIQGIASDNAGGAVVAWRDSRTGDSDVYAQRVNGSAAPLWTGNGVGVCVIAGTQSEIKVETDPRGGAFFAWRDRRGGLTSDVYAQSLDAAGVRRWAENGVSVCNAADDQINPSIAKDGRFGLLLAWQDRRFATDYDIWAQRLKPDGTPRWSGNGVRLTTAASQQTNPLVVPDGAAGVIVGWKDTRVPRPDVYAQRVDSAGVVLWTPSDGVPVCAADSSQFLVTAVTDGMGGAIFGWDDDRSGGAQIFAQAVASNGSMRWTPNGALVATGAGARSLTTSSADGYHGVLFGWQDFRSGATCDIYAFRMSPVGTGVAASASAPGAARLLPARPNPFNPQTVLAFELPRAGAARLALYDARGRLVRSLVDGTLPAGRHEVRWDGRDLAGHPCASGVYFARLTSPAGNASSTLALIR